MSLTFATVLGHTLSPSLLPPSGAVVVDCGANRGDFARHCVSEYSAKVYSYEADSEIAMQFPRLAGVHVENAAVAGSRGTIELRRTSGLCSSVRFHVDSASSRESVSAVTLEDIVSTHDIEHIDLLKLDIEGAEVDVLNKSATETLRRCRQITCEFHDFLDRSDRPRISRLLQALSEHFVVVCMSFFTYGDVLMVNRAAIRDCAGAHRQMLGYKFGSATSRLATRVASSFRYR
jgi:FkbM family methyltransferase